MAYNVTLPGPDRSVGRVISTVARRYGWQRDNVRPIGYGTSKKKNGPGGPKVGVRCPKMLFFLLRAD